MKPVDDQIVKGFEKRGRGSKNFSDENLKTLKENPNQWYEISSVIGDEHYIQKCASYQSSARYFKAKLQGEMKIDFKTTQSRKDKSAILYARVIESTSNGTN